jgi:signal transduction histidine kinase
MANVESRRFGDFQFLSSTANSNVQQRSPLAAYPVIEDLPGVVGYFQVDPNGRFSTPLVPADDRNPQAFGLTSAELGERQAVAAELRTILAENELVSGPQGGRGDTAAAPLAVSDRPTPAAAAEPRPSREAAVGVGAAPATSPGNDDADTALFEQQAFDQLGQAAPLAGKELDERPDASPRAPASRDGTDYGRLQDLRLDDALEKKSEDRKRQVNVEEQVASTAAARTSRLEKAAAPATLAPREAIDSDAIRTFDSEIDPYQFSLLGSGHLVLFRNVWRDGERYIQGLLLEQGEFVEDVIEDAFRNASLSSMSDLVVGYHDAVVDVLRGAYYARPTSASDELNGTMLYRGRLSAPFDSLELIYSVKRMPAGPGASVLAWTTAVLVVVFAAGFAALYWLGLGQIRLARQQQDFVSAVSHELKTPLTSIRMYGEMLREGWASEDKKRQYYEFIHDESERLARLISNVLQLARITRNEPQFELQPVGVRQLVDQVRSKIASQAERAGFELALEMDSDLAATKIDIDVDLFLQIMINLVDNAIKFSRKAQHRRIDMAASARTDGTVAFSVRDYGPGIPRSQLRKIFTLFYRAESELTRETVGTGIGLAIVHQLTTAMRGTVDVLNRDPGAEFIIAFPVTA